MLSGEYIAFLGDDDGLMPYACATASDLLCGRKIDLLSWRAYSYYWPDYYHPAFRNRLLAEIDLTSSAKRVSSRDELARIFGFQAHYANLPMIYNSFVRPASSTGCVRSVAATSSAYRPTWHPVSPMLR